MRGELVWAATFIVACGGTSTASDGGADGGDGSANPIAKVAIASAVGGSPTECRLATSSSIMDPPGAGVLGIGNTNALTIQDGAAWLGGVVKVTCSIIPSGSDFAVSGRADLIGVAQDRVGTFTLSGVFTPKKMGTAPDVMNVQARLTTEYGSLAGTNCTGTFDGMDRTGARCAVGMIDSNGQILCTQNSVMDVKSGAIWATVFCPAATDSSQNPPRTCQTAITFRFENCAQM